MRRCSDRSYEISWEINDEELVRKLREHLGLEVNMKRFESVKVTNETLNDIYGTEIYKIRDNLDEYSPVSNYRALKKSTDELVDWLNENIKEVELKPVDKLEKALKELYKPDEVQLNYYNGRFFIVELEDTGVLSEEIAEKLHIPHSNITVEMMGNNRAIYKIWESCLE